MTNVAKPKRRSNIFHRLAGAVRSSVVLGVLAGATATNVSLSMLIHTFSFNRKKAQGRSMYVIVATYSWAIRLLWWIKVRVNAPQVPEPEQFILSCNHISFLDMFLICHGLYSTMHRRTIYKIRLIYWEALNRVPVVRWVFFLCGGIPVKILGGSSLKEENAYDKESVKKVYAAVEKAFVKDKLCIAMSFEGRRNPTPDKLSKIQRGMFRISTTYKTPILLLRLTGVEKIWPAEGWPSGTGRVDIDLMPEAYYWETLEEYNEGLKKVYEQTPPLPPGVAARSIKRAAVDSACASSVRDPVSKSA